MSAADQAALIGETKGRNPYVDSQSIEFRFRSKRFETVRAQIQAILDRKEVAEIIDLGGTEDYWLIGREFLARNRGRIRITLINTSDETVRDTGVFSFRKASASDQSLYADNSFDMVHSNSVIEHVGRWPDMQDFAANVRRLAPDYYVQTPNYWFAYEPHFRFVGFQYLPEAVRRRLIMTFPLGFFRRIDDWEEAREIIDTHRLLSTRQMRILFPDGHVFHEKAFGLNKSIIATRRTAG
ncbi:MAG: class I SAM-dependent methyltransferase [Rhizobiaceae bacterium]|nr:class I SAM-dependent methyltransferase [Rhizobiaceae bacterium]